MSRWQRRFVLFLLLELAAGAGASWYFLSQPKIPRVDLRWVDPEVAEAIFGHQQAMTLSNDEHWQGLGELYLAFGYVPQAEICAQQAVKIAPGSKDAAYLWAVTLDRLGRLDEAAEKLRRAMELGVSEAPAWIRMGRIELRRESVDEAEQAFRTALKKQPEAMSAAASLCRILLRTNRAAEVSEVISPFVKQAPNACVPCQLMALAEAAQERDDAAENWRLKADWRPEYPRFTDPQADVERWAANVGALWWATRFKEFVAAGQDEAAAAAIHHALTLVGDEQFATRAIAAFLQIKQPHEAQSLVRQVVSVAGRAPYTSFMRGEAYFMSGNKNSAVDAWSESVKFRPSKSAYQRLADYYRQQPEAEKEYLAMALYGAALESYDAGKPEEAVQVLEKSVQFKPDHDLAWLLLGEARRVQGHDAAARRAYEQCLKLNPDQGRARAALRWVTTSSEEKSGGESD